MMELQVSADMDAKRAVENDVVVANVLMARVEITPDHRIDPVLRKLDRERKLAVRFVDGVGGAGRPTANARDAQVAVGLHGDDRLSLGIVGLIAWRQRGPKDLPRDVVEVADGVDAGNGAS